MHIVGLQILTRTRGFTPWERVSGIAQPIHWRHTQQQVRELCCNIYYWQVPFDDDANYLIL